jgi:hypothetical protein
MNNPASSETLFGAVKQWVVSTFWWMIAMLVGPVVLLTAPFFFVAVGSDWKDSEELAWLFLVVSPFVVCFWTVIVNRYFDVKDEKAACGKALPLADHDGRAICKRAVSFVGAFLLGFIMPVVAEFCYIALSSRMAGVSDKAAWFLWWAGYEVAAFSPIILLWARRILRGAGGARTLKTASSGPCT